MAESGLSSKILLMLIAYCSFLVIDQAVFRSARAGEIVIFIQQHTATVIKIRIGRILMNAVG